ncbi:MAG: DUF2791 family P-loop domain-containing protein [Kiritimatiellae bacterium]|nr:DUF2791 family P-loop domain-containing protein [Kiritimatiellia bacterium]
MTKTEAKRVIEKLRKGIPVPDGFVRLFTVGRKDEIGKLENALVDPKSTALLLNANYGSGKTQMLRFLREEALKSGYAVAMIYCDSKAGIRFNRMDQVFGAVCRHIEIPDCAEKGILSFLRWFHEKIPSTSSSYWRKLSANGAWSRSETLTSPALYVALRAYRFGNEESQRLLEDWLMNPQTYKTKRKMLYENFVKVSRQFSDPRPAWKFYQDGVFIFDQQGYAQCWAALTDLDTLAKKSGLKGLVLLFDEFEEILTNLRNIQHEETAILNLFDFNEGKRFSGKTFFAVTPEFVEKCKIRLMDRDRYDFEFARFKKINQFEMSPLSSEQVVELIEQQIIPAHSLAYGWKPKVRPDSFTKWVNSIMRQRIQDRTRLAITDIIKQLDIVLDKQK